MPLSAANVKTRPAPVKQATSAWAHFPGRITRDDALSDPDPLFPEQVDPVVPLRECEVEVAYSEYPFGSIVAPGAS
jgi:hypothetical protein